MLTSEELAVLYRRVLAGQRALILLEDAWDQAQVEPLVPPTGSILVVTSRRRFSLPDFHVLSVDRLGGTDAQALLRRLAPRADDVSARRIVDLCAGVPLAVGLAGGALAHRRDLAPDAYIDRLRVALSRHDLLEATFRTSLALLDSILRTLWSRFGVFVTSFDAHDAKQVASPFPLGMALLSRPDSRGSSPKAAASATPRRTLHGSGAGYCCPLADNRAMDTALDTVFW